MDAMRKVELVPTWIEKKGDGVLDVVVTNDRDWFVRIVLTRRKVMFTDPDPRMRRESVFQYWPGETDGNLLGRIFIPPRNWRCLDIVAHEAVHVGQHVAKLMRKRRQPSMDLKRCGYRGTFMDEEVVAYTTQQIVYAYLVWVGSEEFKQFTANP